MKVEAPLKNMQAVFWLFAYTALLNAPFWFLATNLFLSRALIGFDMFLALLLLQRSIHLGLFSVYAFWLLDLIVSLSLTYHFSSPFEFIRSFRFVGSINIANYLTVSNGMVTLVFLSATILLFLYRKKKLNSANVLLLMTCLVSLDIANGSSALSDRGLRLTSINVTGSSLYAILRSFVERDEQEELKMVPDRTGGVTEAAYLFPEAFFAEHGVLYVVVESFGVPKNINVARWLEQQLGTNVVLDSYSLRTSQVPATAGTTVGELRRLCGLTGSYRSINDDSARECLPNIFKLQGWETYGFHGFSEKMFDRISWWPKIGIQKMFFAEQLSSEFKNRCGGAFRGMCDADIIRLAKNYLNGMKRFVYLLTLNSHLPLVPNSLPADLSELCAREKINKETCALVSQVGISLSALSAGIQSLQFKPVVIVVGDHSPPFVNRFSREQFFQNSVPIFVLVPRNLDNNIIDGL